MVANPVVAVAKERRNKMEFERRRSIRLYPEKMMEVAFTSKGKRITGRIHNISTNGLAVEYEATSSLDADKEISVSLSASMKEVSSQVTLNCKPVYDITTLAHDQNFSGKQMRQCGLVYNKPSPGRRAQLDRLLAWLAA